MYKIYLRNQYFLCSICPVKGYYPKGRQVHAPGYLSTTFKVKIVEVARPFTPALAHTSSLDTNKTPGKIWAVQPSPKRNHQHTQNSPKRESPPFTGVSQKTHRGPRRRRCTRRGRHHITRRRRHAHASRKTQPEHAPSQKTACSHLTRE